jgi:biopolymer transport protein ExbD
MAEKRRFLDIWIVESNTVYKEVPFTVVTDWVQQGRLLGEDKVKPSGTAQWFLLGEMPALAAYLPKSEPFRVEDQAEALEPVEVDFHWKRGPDDEEDDVDMIPLIDISLVLLIFFMMTTAVKSGLLSPIPTPRAERSLDTIVRMKGSWWVGIDYARDFAGKPRKDEAGKDVLVYTVGTDDPDPEMKKLTFPPTQDKESLAKALDPHLARGGGVRIRIRANKALPVDVVKEVVTELEAFKGQGRLDLVQAEVSEPQ